MSGIGNKNDGATLTLSLVTLFLAGVLSINTFSGQTAPSSLSDSSDPFEKAEAAAQAGIEIAKWHIECHGWTNSGNLPAHFWVNGAMYSVEWDNMDISDSTVIIRSWGEIKSNDNMTYKMNKTSKVKISFLPNIQNQILGDYYSQKKAVTSEEHIH